MMLDYPSLAAVSAVIREGTFERAAASLGVTPSAISQRVRGLEERLGAVLINRGQPCDATDLGRILCAHFDRVRLLEHDLESALGQSAYKAGLPPTLMIAVNADSLATWFHAAVASFGQTRVITVDLKLDDEAHTADRLRSGEVLAAVTADPAPVQGCKTVPLGALRYAACASPEFIGRYFDRGVNSDSLAQAPHLRFDRRDMLQAQWARKTHRADLAGPVHWVPSTLGCLDLTLAGLGWAMHPLALIEDHIDSGRLIELPPGERVDVKLYWTVTRLHAGALGELTQAVRAVAACELRQSGA